MPYTIRRLSHQARHIPYQAKKEKKGFPNTGNNGNAKTTGNKATHNWALLSHFISFCVKWKERKAIMWIIKEL